MLTFITAIIIGLLAAYGSGYAMHNMSWGAIIGIAAGAIAILGIGSFCIYWFVIRKKKFAK